jgi:hypothetical protein
MVILKYLVLVIVFIVNVNNVSLLYADPNSLTIVSSSSALDEDLIPPKGKILINNNQPYTNSLEVELTLSAVDYGSGMGMGAQMQFSNNNIAWSAPQPYATAKEWVLIQGDGIKKVFVRFKDVAGNWSKPVYDTIILDSTPPQPPILNAVTTPTGISTQLISGTKESNTSIWINGAQAVAITPELTWSYELNLSQGSNLISIYAQDYASNNSLPVVSDIFYDSTAPLQPQVFDEGENTISTSELHANWHSEDPETGISEYLYAIGTTQGENGTEVLGWTSAGFDTEITVTNLNLSIGQTYYFNVKARNAVNLLSDVGYSDGITVLNQSPEIISFTPQNNATFTQGDSIEISVQAQDPNNEVLQYQYSIDGQIVQDWTLQATYVWQTQPTDVKSKQINIEVRDEHGTVVSGQSNIFIFRKPPEPE